MRTGVAALVALLLVLVPLGGAVTVPAASDDLPGRGSDTVVDDEQATVVITNTTSDRTRILTIPPGTTSRSGLDTVTIDVGVTTTIAGNVTAVRLETIALRNRIQATESTETRATRTRSALDSISQRAETLRDRQRQAIVAYGEERISGRELLLRLAEIRLTAAALTERVQMLDRLAEETPGLELNESRIQALAFDLRTFGGPVTDRVTAGLQGETGTVRVYIETGAESVVLTTITNEAYVREVYRGDLRQSGDRGIDPTVARNVTVASYPEIWRLRTGTPSGQGSGATFVYNIDHRNGSLTAFIDAGSERVFKEYQRIPLENASIGPAVNRTQDDLTLRVNRTYPGGPLRVSLVDATTGDPVDAVVRIGPPGGDSVRVGRTGPDGILWTLAPRERFQVTTVEPDSVRVARVTLRPLDPVTVNESVTATTTPAVHSDPGT